ncbi:MAG: esterase [Flavobacterium psychrophilum]|nr:MAG: esterase [Flavobacterium psychrophilum]
MCPKREHCIQKTELTILSTHLDREVQVDIYHPEPYNADGYPPLLLINDGQNMDELDLVGIMDKGFSENQFRPFVAVAIHAGEARKREYGTAGHPDYLNRGDLAGAYTRFVFEECLPLVRRSQPWPEFSEKVFAGFSLGGLSALDIVWAHPQEFSAVGVFSGSLWWRNLAQTDKAYDDDKNRIMHQLVRHGQAAPWLRFFFETGTLDETSDRNNNGIIDSIDDTLDMIGELKAKGYSDQQIRYMELADGKHDIATWGRAMPEFLQWCLNS